MKQYLKSLFSSEQAQPAPAPVRKSLTQIVAGFQSVINELDALASQNSADISRKNGQIEDLQKQVTHLATEADGANKIASNLKALLS